MSCYAYLFDPISSRIDSVLDYIDGNICRCTGYKSILRAATELEKFKNVGMSLGVKEEKDIVSIIQKINNHPSLQTLMTSTPPIDYRNQVSIIMEKEKLNESYTSLSDDIGAMLSGITIANKYLLK